MDLDLSLRKPCLRAGAVIAYDGLFLDCWRIMAGTIEASAAPSTTRQYQDGKW